MGITNFVSRIADENSLSNREPASELDITRGEIKSSREALIVIDDKLACRSELTRLKVVSFLDAVVEGVTNVVLVEYFGVSLKDDVDHLAPGQWLLADAELPSDKLVEVPMIAVVESFDSQLLLERNNLALWSKMIFNQSCNVAAILVPHL